MALSEGKYAVHMTHRGSIGTNRTHSVAEVEADDKRTAMSRAAERFGSAHKRTAVNAVFDLGDAREAEMHRKRLSPEPEHHPTVRTPAFTGDELDRVKRTRLAIHMKWLASKRKKSSGVTEESQFQRMQSILRRDAEYRQKLFYTLGRVGAQSKTEGGIKPFTRALLAKQRAQKRTHDAVVKRNIEKLEN